MNRNNFLPHVALALVLILIAAFAGQLRKWQTQWKQRVRIIPAEEKRRTPINSIETATDEARNITAPEVMVKFKAGVSEETIARITSGLNDQIEDQIEAVPGLEAIDDMDDESADIVAAQYRGLPEVEYAEPVFELSIEDVTS